MRLSSLRSLHLDFRFALAAIVLVTLVRLGVDILTDDSPSSSGDTFARVDAYVRDQAEDSRIPGVAIAIVEGAGLVHSQGFGNDGHGESITPTTPFWIGSNTKSFTALATMQLVESGLVDLDAPVQRYLPGFRVADEDASAAITVRHLLNQTSGFSRASGIEPLLNEELKSLEEAVADLRDVDLATPVGESFAYSNLNSVVLGLLVQEVSGEPWTEYVAKNILDPLGMGRTYTSLEAAQEAGLTAVHRYWFGYPVQTEGKYLPSLAPSGFLYSTAEDIGRYLSMYLRDGALDGASILSGAGVELMLFPATETTTRSLMSHAFELQYGAGWFVGPFGVADDARWHLGNLAYFTAWMILLPDSNQGVVVLINAGSQFEIAGANEVMSRIPIGVVNILRGEDPPEGISIARFFIVANGLVTLALLVQAWSLVRVARQQLATGAALLTRVRRFGPLVWEFGVTFLILLVGPSAFRLSWPQLFKAIPDLALVLVVLVGLWILTGIVRSGRWAWSLIARTTRGVSSIRGTE